MKLLKKVVFVVFLVLIDFLSKVYIIRNFNFVKNMGTVFGLFQGHNLAFILINITVILFIVYYLRKENSLIFILGGALGNLIDRLIYGYVVDFIDLKIWPSFNLADVFIIMGIILLILKNWKK